MNFRSILGSIVALPLLYVAATASDRASPRLGDQAELPGVFVPLPQAGLRGAPAPDGGVIRLAQAGDPRVTQLEEQIRQLSGTIEELNFQVLQMQEQMRKMQEDNEFRFQAIEGKGSASGAGKTKGAGEKPRSENVEPAPVQGSETTASAPAAPAGDDVAVQPATAGQDPALAPKSMGTITFDKSGNVTGGSVGDQATMGGAGPAPAQEAVDPAAPAAGAGAGSDGTTVAALPATNDPEELYRNSYQFILSGDYSTAEAGFRDHIARFPDDTKAADAHFWLGEALLGQKKYRDAAEVFLAANRDYPKSKKAPEMLLKLGVSLVGLNQRDVACATFSEVGKRYPQTSAALRERVKQEQALAAC
jgi:tol-pal system protein YbgF